MFRASAATVAVAAALLANGASDALEQVDIWKAVGELGIAIVFAVLGFVGMGWWIRKRGAEQRADSLARDKRIDALEQFQQEKLVGLAETSARTTVASEQAMRENTSQLVRLTDALMDMCDALRSRTCAALEILPEKERAQVVKLLRARKEAD